MANLTYSSEIIDDALFRSGEPTDGSSDFESVALIYLNRSYRSLWMGGSEFAPNIHEDWWWLKSEGSIILQPSIKTGTVSVTVNNTAITFSSGPSASVAGYFFKVDNHPDVFRISTHTAGATAAVLDTVYTGDTAATATYRLMKLEYDLASNALKVMAPMKGYQNGGEDINGCSLSEIERDYPLHLLQSGVPERFAMVDEDTVRFNRYGSDDGDLMRIDYDFMRKPSDLTNSGSEEPLVPLAYRHVLSDMTTYFLLLDKDDNRAPAIGLQAKAGIQAMSNENRSRFATTGELGKIYPRQSKTKTFGRLLRTESGLIIG